MTDKLSLYLHIPFCIKKCAYCDFYSGAKNDFMLNKYTEKLSEEIKKWGGRTDLPIDTVYFGGGTPSVLNINQVSELLCAVFKNFSVEKDCEITFEANPKTVDFNYLKALKSLGINRLSLGFQSADDRLLKLLGRTHSSKDSIECFNDARKAGFDNISLDLMLGIPDSSINDTKKSLEVINQLNPEHISAYMLILEENTLFYKHRENYSFPEDDYVAEEYLSVCNYLIKNGYSHYEISNFCKKNKQSRHNNKYWLDKMYLGLGPSAYSYFNKKRFHFKADLRGFLKNPEVVFDEQGGDLFEYIMLSLRLKRGLLKSEIKKRYKKTFSNSFFKKAEQLKDAGYLDADSEHISLTENGMLVSNAIINEFTKEEFYEDI